MKTAFITGVNRGLGRQFLEQLSLSGYRVYGLVRSPQAYEALQREALPNVIYILADVAEDNCREAIQAIVADHPVELLINNAGIGGEGMRLSEVQPSEVLELLNIHCLGALRVVQALEANLLAAQAPLVLNMNSRFGSIAYQYQRVFAGMEISYAYRIAKAAQNMLTNCLSVELGNHVQVVSVTPGRLKTSMAQTDANLSAEEGARRIIHHWEQGHFRPENGILQIEGDMTPW